MLTPHAIPALGNLAEALLTLPERYSYPARVCMWMGFLFASALFLRTQNHRWGTLWEKPHLRACGPCKLAPAIWRRSPHLTEWPELGMATPSSVK